MKYGRLLSEWSSMRQPQDSWQDLVGNSLIAEQVTYDRVALAAELEDRLSNLNNEQRAAYDRIVSSVANREGKVFFLNGPGGTGKTFVYNTVCAKLRGDGYIVLCVSSSGSSALLLRGGRTAHSTFKIPINNLHDQSVCSVHKNTQCAELFRATKAIIWDEIGAQHRLAVEAVDRTLRDICGSIDHSEASPWSLVVTFCRPCQFFRGGREKRQGVQLFNAPAVCGTLLRFSDLLRICAWIVRIQTRSVSLAAGHWPWQKYDGE
jgi:hypothetical protein